MAKITAEQVLWLDTATPRQRIYATQNDFLLFFSYYFFHYVKAPFADFHYEMGQDIKDLIDGNLKELGWFMFRESAKTSLGKGVVSWCIAHKKYEYINVDSHDKGNSGRFLFDVVLELQTNRRLKQDFGELFNAKRTDEQKTQKSITDFLTSNGVRVEAHSTQEPIRGRLHGSTRPQFVIMDDFEDMTTVRSEAMTRQVRDHIAEFKGGLDQERGRVLYLGNYLSEAGTVQSIMDRAKIDPSLRVRTVWILDSQNNPSWPQKHVLSDLEAKETGKISIEEIKRRMWTPEVGSADFDREMMGDPVSEKYQEFKMSWVKSIEQADLDKMETVKYMSIDTAISATAKSDFTGIAICYVSGENKWHLKSYRLKINASELINTIFTLHESHNFDKIGVEKTVYLDAIKPFLDQEQRRRNRFLPITELKHNSVQKEARIRGLIPRYESGSVFHVKQNGVSLCKELEEEMVRFPRGTHDDVLDATAYLTQLVEDLPIAAKEPRDTNYDKYDLF